MTRDGADFMRAAHGAGASALARVETPAVDELPDGVPGPARPDSRVGRGTNGRFAGGNPHASEGGRARAGKTRLASQLGLAPIDADPAFGPYKRAADAFRVAHCNELAASVGGGQCGSGPSSIVASAALALAASRFIYDTAKGDPDKLKMASQLGAESRTALITAHALAAKEAQGRPKRGNRIKELLGT
jgi:hypothetical protein